MHISGKSAMILGAGPAGLASALELARNHVKTTVVEREAEVGGLCRTLRRDGYYFDIGGHRFFSKNREINELWREVLQDDYLVVNRKSRIFYNKRYFDYPLSLPNVIKNLGMKNSFFCFLSYLKSQWRRRGDDSTFEGWISNRFGARLYRIFFKSYTEKVWNIPCQTLSSDWAIQRIQGMSLRRALLHAILKNQNRFTKSLVTEFIYPIYGPGLFSEKLKRLSESLGSQYLLRKEVTAITHDDRQILEITLKGPEGEMQNHRSDYYLSSIPLTVLVQRLVPPPPEEIVETAERLRFRSFIVVNVILNRKNVFEDNWIYVHDPSVKLARIQNYKNWSHFMVKDPEKTSLGLEYFASEGDELWTKAPEDMIDFAMKELEAIGLGPGADLIDAFVVKIPKVYPIYHKTYREDLETIRRYLEGFSNLQVMGRTGMFRYDNSDHALLTGLYAARNLFGHHHDLWNVNTDPEYHEELGPYNKVINGIYPHPEAHPAGTP